MTIRPATTLLAERSILAGWRVVLTRPESAPIVVSFDTTHDVAAAALLCEAVVITDNLDVRHACRAIRVRVLWPEEVNQ
jgi:hypothetical protein